MRQRWWAIPYWHHLRRAAGLYNFARSYKPPSSGQADEAYPSSFLHSPVTSAAFSNGLYTTYSFLFAVNVSTPRPGISTKKRKPGRPLALLSDFVFSTCGFRTSGGWTLRDDWEPRAWPPHPRSARGPATVNPSHPCKATGVELGNKEHRHRSNYIGIIIATIAPLLLESQVNVM